MNTRTIVLVMLAGLALGLLPPGRGGRKLPLDSTQLTMPTALANGSRATRGRDVTMRAVVSPAPARVGQRLTYRGFAYVDAGAGVKFVPPGGGGDFTWGTPRAGKRTSTRAGGYGYPSDSAWVEVPLQVFRTGIVHIPGLAVQLAGAGGAGRPLVTRLPTVHLVVLPTVTAADSAATLRPLHGPLGAPWWERVPWRIVLAVLWALLILAIFLRWVAGMRRRKVPAVTPVAAARPAIDPAAEALAALAELRALDLPAQGRFGEHALSLTRILRRYLERTLGTPRPGDTSAELIVRARASRLEAADVQRLEGLLGLWDRVKFARAPLDADEAGRCEAAVELLVRRRERPREVA